MKLLLFLSTLFIATFSFSQALPTVDVCLGDDALACQNQPVKITRCNPTNPNLGGVNLVNPTTVLLSDDIWSGVVPIGFPFSFYGNNYSNCIIGSNGLISFNTANAGGYCAYIINAGNTLPSVPNLPATKNSIMVAYQDIVPNASGGNIQYETIGTAPNRKFVVLYQNVYFFSCTSVCNNYAMILNEGSNTIEFHIGNKAICTQFNGGRAIQGVQNNAGTVATITAGRNGTVWVANQDSRLFSPTSATNTTAYTDAPMPYTQVTGTNGALQWSNTAGASFPYNNGVLNIANVPAGTTGYFVSGSACGASLGAVSDTTWITRSDIDGTVTTVSDFCSTATGSATVVATGAAPFTYLWTPSGQTTATATGLNTGAYTVRITNADGCIKNITTNVANNNSTATITSTLVSCPGGSDGTATASMVPVNPNTQYDWYDLGNQTTATVTGLAAGVYHCKVTSGTGCVDTATVTITEIPGMIATIASQSDVTCNSGSDGKATITTTQGTAPYTYLWSIESSANTTNTATDLNAGTHTVTIKDAKGCIITKDIIIGEPQPLSVAYISPDITICAEDSTTLTATGAGGSSAYIYQWTSNGVVVGSQQTIRVDPLTSGTQYCVRVTEVCGSPEANQCMIVTFPTELIPNIVPDKASDCQPGTFTFTNNTNDPQEILTTYLNLGNNIDTTLEGNASVTSQYPLPRKYTVDVLITSIHGCVYTKSFPDIVETIASPVSSFTMSANPATIFETSIQMQNNSSPEVVYWEWSAPDATPISSTLEDPTFHFPEGIVGNYPVQLIVTTAQGCKDTVETTVHIVSDITFFAPNAFTPDGNEFNQTWKVYINGIDIYNYDMVIYNRWGQVIWESHNPEEGWDGTYNGELVPAGTYTWKAQVKDLYSDGAKTFQGFITLLK